ncbi:MAG: phosphoribosylaminoimidazolesuccinocarboxamide synthase [candidate division KSB1 bacterium]|nr:phosphoribosylaminoimidazolesuccinocarboxamide synthase [candidate division KSB1 bacterium]MDZ7334938.1 phosphoribosylaminoimidazolesuccinocarboxamide synthase [candidate division KSB1 bacterium]MDZ7358377.1 phosphoribosylaminoimidazolesuccinocarboxamide synthase [candidate division KSB1 bacterium]MDZ7376388.1 phosphoribosylaminoimidazolesuccinocarboxamide synthase [candidate division KSB1 bacterium]MDZ7401710.1 phosphoribosylaminoimidazolesuccinocarboxamide synthase [candidate division KSB1
MNFSQFKKIIEGKTKIIYENPDDPQTVFMVFKDDITAGDGAKHDILEGKALLDWQTNRDIFEYLNRMGVKTHYISSPEQKVSLVRKLDQKINLEVVTRRIATGSILKWSSIAEGTRFDPPITQFYYKDDFLHDPMLDNGFIDHLIRDKNSQEYAIMRATNERVFILLEQAFAQFNIQLVDFKLEYGIINGEVLLIDEITGGSLRLWPYAKEHPNFNQPNVLSELDPSGRLDKDIYRRGEELSKVRSKFETIAQITLNFKNLTL